MTKIALFAGSFDPFTRGHEAVVDAALRLFDEVVIGVGENVSKRGLLPIEERCRLIEDVYAENGRVRVARYSNLTGEFAREVGATVLVKGVRGTADLEYEQHLAEINRLLAPEVETVLLPTRPQFAAVSSTYARAFLTGGKDPSALLPEAILNDIGN